jgi:hypothetical protein
MMQNSILERLLVTNVTVVEYMTEISIENFGNFMVMLGSEVENCWKKLELSHIFLNNFEALRFCWNKYYFSESLGCKLIENCHKAGNFRQILCTRKKAMEIRSFSNEEI